MNVILEYIDSVGASMEPYETYLALLYLKPNCKFVINSLSTLQSYSSSCGISALATHGTRISVYFINLETKRMPLEMGPKLLDYRLAQL